MGSTPARMVYRCEGKILDPCPEVCNVILRVYVVDHLSELLVVAPVLQALCEGHWDRSYLKGHVFQPLAV